MIWGLDSGVSASEFVFLFSFLIYFSNYGHFSASDWYLLLVILFFFLSKWSKSNDFLYLNWIYVQNYFDFFLHLEIFSMRFFMMLWYFWVISHIPWIDLWLVVLYDLVDALTYFFLFHFIFSCLYPRLNRTWYKNMYIR